MLGSDQDFIQQSIKFAYTYQDSQPVLCTYIGDQPLFYTENDIAFDDENYLEEGDLLLSLTSDAITQHSQERAMRTNNFKQENAPSIYEAFDSNTYFLKEKQDLKEIVKKVTQSRLAKELYAYITEYGVCVEEDNTIDKVFYDSATEIIYVPMYLSKGSLYLGLAEAIRLAYHHKKGALIHPLHFMPDEAVIINRVIQADLAVIKTRIAWEISLLGDKEALQKLCQSHLSEMVLSLITEVKADFRHLNNGWAMQYLFDKWFLTDLCRIEDRLLIQEMLADQANILFNTETISKNVSAQLIAQIGFIPFGQNYLSAITQTLINDPIYTEVRDRSSANFLWFIKFETAYQEKEQELYALKTDQKMVQNKLFDQETAEYKAVLLDFPKVYKDTHHDSVAQNNKRSASIIRLFD